MMSLLQQVDGTMGLSGDRRSLLKRAGGLGLALPAIAVLGGRGAQAQDVHDEHVAPTPEGYVGSDASTEGSTGAASPVPAGQIQPFAVYDPVLPAVQAGSKQITVTAIDITQYVAKDVAFASWSYDGTIPGKTLRVVEGDEIDFTLAIDPNARIGHSLDFHSAQTPPDVNYRTINPGETLNWTFTPKYPGAFMYHCGTPPVLMHIGAGMYGAMIVDPKEGWSPAQEFILVQSEYYLKDGGNGVMVPDYTKMMGNGDMDYVVFNGYANQYVDNPIQVRVGEPVRVFVVNCGPNIWSSFHVVGAIFDRVCVNANPKNELFGMQSVTIGPGDGACVEFTIEEPGSYPAVNHAFGHAAHGAIAIFQAS